MAAVSGAQFPNAACHLIYLITVWKKATEDSQTKGPQDHSVSVCAAYCLKSKLRLSVGGRLLTLTI